MLGCYPTQNLVMVRLKAQDDFALMNRLAMLPVIAILVAALVDLNLTPGRVILMVYRMRA